MNQPMRRGRITFYDNPAADDRPCKDCETYAVHHQRPLENCDERGPEIGGWWVIVVANDGFWCDVHGPHKTRGKAERIARRLAAARGCEYTGVRP